MLLPLQSIKSLYRLLHSPVLTAMKVSVTVERYCSWIFIQYPFDNDRNSIRSCCNFWDRGFKSNVKTWLWWEKGLEIDRKCSFHCMQMCSKPSPSLFAISPLWLNLPWHLRHRQLQGDHVWTWLHRILLSNLRMWFRGPARRAQRNWNTEMETSRAFQWDQ